MTRMLRLPKVIEITGLGRSTIYDEIAAGRFPPQVKIGQRAVAWPADEIESYLEARKAERAA